MSDNARLSNDNKAQSRDRCDTQAGPCACGAWHTGVPAGEWVEPHSVQVNCPVDNQPEDDYEPVYATLHFNLDDPEGLRRLRECMDAPRWKSAVWEFDQWMRNNIKYGTTDDFMKTIGRTTPDTRDVAEDTIAAVRAHLHTVFGERGIDIWED